MSRTIAMTGVTGSLGRQLLAELARRDARLQVIAIADLSERTPLDHGLCFHLTADSDTRLSDIMESVSQTFPDFEIHFRPDIQPEELTGASRLLDTALLDLKGYLAARLSFDRRNTRHILGNRFQEPRLDLVQRAAKRRREIATHDRFPQGVGAY